MDGRGFGEGPPASIDTPVITRPLGATPGFVGESVEDLVAAVKRSDTLPRLVCRRHVEQRFSVSRMVDDCEAL